MDTSLLLLSRLRLRAGWRKVKRGLRTPMGIVAALFILAWLGMLLVPRLIIAYGVKEPPPQVALTKLFHPAALFAFWLMTNLAGRMKGPLAFSPAEVDFLFPGPYTRRKLLTYKLLTNIIAALGLALLMPLFSGGLFVVSWPVAILGVWWTLAFMQMASVLVALVTESLASRRAIALPWSRSLRCWRPPWLRRCGNPVRSILDLSIKPESRRSYPPAR